jgi:hypothetical protein
MDRAWYHRVLITEQWKMQCHILAGWQAGRQVKWSVVCGEISGAISTDALERSATLVAASACCCCWFLEAAIPVGRFPFLIATLGFGGQGGSHQRIFLVVAHSATTCSSPRECLLLQIGPRTRFMRARSTRHAWKIENIRVHHCEW